MIKIKAEEKEKKDLYLKMFSPDFEFIYLDENGNFHYKDSYKEYNKEYDKITEKYSIQRYKMEIEHYKRNENYSIKIYKLERGLFIKEHGIENIEYFNNKQRKVK
jgi:hypothetical protein